MSLIQLNSKEKIRNYEENLKTKGSVEDMKSIRFISENEVVIPGKFKCQYACIGDMRNALMSLSMSKEASSLLHFAEKVIVGDVDGNKGRTYFQEMERTMKAVKTEINMMTGDFQVIPEKLYKGYPLLNEVLELTDALYYTCFECEANMLGEEEFMASLVTMNGCPHWYDFFSNTAEIIEMFEKVMDIFGKDICENIRGKDEQIK